MGWRDPARRRDASSGSCSGRNKRCDRARPQGPRRPRRHAAAVRRRRRARGELPARHARARSAWAPTCCSRATPAWWSPGSPGSARTARTPAAPGFATLAEAMSRVRRHQRRARRAAAAAADRPHRRGHRARRPPSPRWSPLHSGVGQVVDVNLLESLFQLMGPLVGACRAHRLRAAPAGLGHPLLRAAGHLPHRRRPVGGGVSTSAESVARRVMELVGAGRRRAASPPSPAGSPTASEVDAPDGRRGSPPATARRGAGRLRGGPRGRRAGATTMADIAADPHFAAAGAIVERRRRPDAGPRRPAVGHAGPAPLGGPAAGGRQRRAAPSWPDA